MDKLFLSKSSYCDCIQCNKMFWLNKYKKDLAVVNVNDNILENGRKVGEFAKGLFGDYVEVPYDLSINKRIEKTKELLENNQNVIAEASFNYDNNFCSVDLLKINPDGVEIYEVKSSTEIKNIYYEDIAYQYYVLSNLGLTVNGAYIVYVNNKYIKIGELDIEQYFKNEKRYSPAGSKRDEGGNYDWVATKSYKVKEAKDRFLFSTHGHNSEYMINSFIPLKIEESIAVIHHMGYAEELELKDLSAIYDKYPLALLLYTADLISTFVDESY